MWSKKYWKVQFKLASRKLRRSPQFSFYSVMGTCVFSLITFLIYQNMSFNNNQYVSTFTQWQKTQEEVNLHRKPASFNGDFNCSNAATNLTQLKAEVERLERKYQTGSIIEGNIFGIDLSTLPSIAAQLLADNKSLIGDQASDYNFSFCKTLPCVLNQVYNDPSNLSGYYSYYWYLKTGSLISTTNFIPNQNSHLAGIYNNKKNHLSDYLFSQNELKNFYFLAKSLPEKLTYLPLLKSIHKIPNHSSIEGTKSCSLALPNGQILLGSQCLRAQNNEFFINVSAQIAKYSDREEGLKKNLASVSSSDKWLDQSMWVKESYFDIQNHKYNYKWHSGLQKNQFVSQKSSVSPTEQLANLIAHFRYNPANFTAKTPLDITSFIKNDFFFNRSFDSNGLYSTFLNTSLNDWSKQESSIWNDCIDQYLREDDLKVSARDLASTLEHPLYSCVEKKIPHFMDLSINKIKKESYEGCRFFSDHNKFAHAAKRYFSSLRKFLNEKVLQRKIEIQRHGKEVLIGQKIKDQFLSSIDPKTIYINCFTAESSKTCFEKTMSKMLQNTIDSNEKISDYYSQTLRDDIHALFTFSSIKMKTNEAAKMFLAPYNTRLTQAATKLWDSCKIKGMDTREAISLPMRFSGGRYFVNAKLINCINNKLDKEIFQLAQLSAFHKRNGHREEFTLNSKEQNFALSFLEGNLIQTLNNILSREFVSEKIMFQDHFRRTKIQALSEFTNREDFTQNIFSKNEVTGMCLDEIQRFYPKNYFYHAKSQVDVKFGRKICSSLIELPDMKKKIETRISNQWEINKELANTYLREEYSSLVNDCYNDYPQTQGSAQIKHDQLRSTCIRLSYNQALAESSTKWRAHKNYKHFSQREAELQSFLNSKKKIYINQAMRNQEIL